MLAEEKRKKQTIEEKIQEQVEKSSVPIGGLHMLSDASAYVFDDDDLGESKAFNKEMKRQASSKKKGQRRRMSVY